MDKISSKDEDRLIQGTKTAVILTNQGLTPNEALTKVALDMKLEPEYIQRMAEAYNKSKAVSHLSKEAAGDSRALPHPLAEPSEIIKNIYDAPQEKVASECRTPVIDFSDLGLTKDNGMEKAASAALEVEKIPASSIRNRLDKVASMCERLKKDLYHKHLTAKRDFSNALEKAAEEFHTLPKNRIPKVAQQIINGYPHIGARMLDLIASKSRVTFPQELQKNAHSVVFPNEEPYNAVGELYASANRLAMQEAANKEFYKEADAATELFNVYMQGRQGEKTKKSDVKVTDELLDAVDPKVLEELKKLEAKRNLMELTVYDPDISKYSTPDILRAYNQSVGNVESAYNKPEVLRNLMLQNLESGGIKDPFQLKQEADLAQAIEPGNALGEEII